MHKIAILKFSEKIFKAYDIRGKYPDEINEDAAYKIARAFAMYLGLVRQLADRDKGLNIVVSSDDRPSSPDLKMAFIEGLLDEGAQVIDAGVTTTPMHYFAVNKSNADGGAMITASHRPFSYNGIKLSKRGAEILGEGNGLEEIRNTALRGVFTNKNKGNIIAQDFKENYFIFFEEKFLNLKDFKITINANLENSIVSIVFDDLIGRFPKFKISSKKYDFGVSFDRDGDRVKFTDEIGNEISGDIITAFLIKRFKEDFKKQSINSTFIHSINSSRVVKEEIEKFGGIAVESRIGHSFIKKAMRENEAEFGGELSGHYYFRDFFSCDSALFAMFCVIDLLRKEKKSLSELIKPLLRYASTSELNFEVQNKSRRKVGTPTSLLENNNSASGDMLIDKAAAAFSDGKISYLDGIKIDYPDWWFILRPSNTEDLIRLRLEANTSELLEEKKKQVLKALDLV